MNMSLASDSKPEDLQTLNRFAVTDKGYEIGVYQFNGKMWDTLTKWQKEFFIAGLQEGVVAYYVTSGVAITSQQSEYLKLKDSYFVKGFGPPEIANIIDDIYKDKSNILIPVSEILRVSARKAEGVSRNEIEDLLSELRKKFAN